MRKSIRRNTAEKELRLAQGHVFTRREYEARGAQYMGTVGEAAKLGYYTPAGCNRLNKPVTEAELEDVRYCAMYKDCFVDQTILEDGRRKRPCLPVFKREISEEGSLS